MCCTTVATSVMSKGKKQKHTHNPISSEVCAVGWLLLCCSSGRVSTQEAPLALPSLTSCVSSFFTPVLSTDNPRASTCHPPQWLISAALHWRVAWKNKQRGPCGPRRASTTFLHCWLFRSWMAAAQSGGLYKENSWLICSDFLQHCSLHMVSDNYPVSCFSYQWNVTINWVKYQESSQTSCREVIETWIKRIRYEWMHNGILGARQILSIFPHSHAWLIIATLPPPYQPPIRLQESPVGEVLLIH